jgi:hypothetical protein
MERVKLFFRRIFLFATVREIFTDKEINFTKISCALTRRSRPTRRWASKLGLSRRMHHSKSDTKFIKEPAYVAKQTSAGKLTARFMA